MTERDRESDAPPPAPSMERLRGLIAERVDVYRRSPGMVLGLSDDGRREIVAHGVADAAEGTRATAGTVFEIGSVTKLFTALLLADMAHRREVSLIDPVTVHLPDRVDVPERDGRGITLVDLAKHTSALPRMPTNFDPADPARPYADYTVEDLYSFLADYRLSRPVGCVTSYSNVGYALLGHVLERAAGEEYGALVRSRICEPLGLRSTGVATPPGDAARVATGHDDSLEAVPYWDLGVFVGAGGLRSDAADLLTFLEAFGGGSPLDDAVGIVMRGVLEGRATVFHGGGTGGFRTGVAVAPAWRRAAVVLSNAVCGATDDLCLHALDPRRSLDWLRREAGSDAADLGAYEGRYRVSPELVLDVTREDGRLFLRATGRPVRRLFPAGDHSFFAKTVAAQVTFRPNGDGSVPDLVLHHGGADRVAVRIE